MRARDRQLTKPAGSLGRLEWLRRMGGRVAGQVALDRPSAWSASSPASHGVVARGVSAFPPEVNRQMLENFAAGGAAINQICADLGLGFKVFDLAIDMPTNDIVEDAAMDEKSCVATMAFGMESLAGGTDLLAVGEMGIGNTTIAAAIYTALYGGDAAHWVGRGTGVDDEGVKRKIAAVEGAIARHREHLGDPLEVLRRLGGREIAAIAGAILAARLQRIPVILDGYVTTAAAAILHAIHPATLDHCIAGPSLGGRCSPGRAPASRQDPASGAGHASWARDRARRWRPGLSKLP